MTNADLFKSALQKIGVLAENQSVSPEQGADMLLIFNDMMESLRGQGIDLGFAPQSSTTDDPDIQEGYREIIKCMLAVKAAPHFEIYEFSPDIGLTATMGYNRMLREAVYRDMMPRRMDHLPFNTGGRLNIITGQ